MYLLFLDKNNVIIHVWCKSLLITIIFLVINFITLKKTINVSICSDMLDIKVRVTMINVITAYLKSNQVRLLAYLIDSHNKSINWLEIIY